MKTIPLTQGKVALVDDADYEAVSQFKWHAVKTCEGFFYAARGIRTPDGVRKQLLHRFLLPGVAQIDHVNGDRLNNQRYNLRPATQRQNRQGFNRKRRGATSKFRGVSWCRARLKWAAAICVNGKRIFLGLFVIEKDAALAYDAAARKYFGKFACPNFEN